MLDVGELFSSRKKVDEWRGNSILKRYVWRREEGGGVMGWNGGEEVGVLDIE